MNPVPPTELKQVFETQGLAERQQALKDTMAALTSGVVVVTACHDGHDWGMTCSSFTTVSLDPALVLWCLHRGSASHAAFTQPGAQGGGYCVSVLDGAQAELALQFARGSQAERFAGTAIERCASGRARLAGARAWFDCTLHENLGAGDHDILIGRILDFGLADGESLAYTQRRFGTVHTQPSNREA